MQPRHASAGNRFCGSSASLRYTTCFHPSQTRSHHLPGHHIAILICSPHSHRRQEAEEDIANHASHLNGKGQIYALFLSPRLVFTSRPLSILAVVARRECGVTALILHALPILASPLRLAMANPLRTSPADLCQVVGGPGSCSTACSSLPGVEMACDFGHDPLDRGSRA